MLWKGVSFSNLRMRAAGAATGDALGNCILATTVTDFMAEFLWLENGRSGLFLRTNSARCLLRSINAKDMVGQHGIHITGSSLIDIDGGVFTNSPFGIVSNEIRRDRPRKSCNDTDSGEHKYNPK